MSKRYLGGELGAGLNPLKAPNPPSNVSASVSGSGAAYVTFSPPSDVGGSNVTSYGVISIPAAVSRTVSSSATSIGVNGLTDNTTYTFAVTALNSYGSSYGAITNSITPAPETSWIAMYNHDGIVYGGSKFFNISVDYSGLSLVSDTYPYAEALVMKLTPSGDISWTSRIAAYYPTYNSLYLRAVYSDNSKVYAFGYDNTGGAGGTYLSIHDTNTGRQLSNVKLVGAGTGVRVTSDASSNIYLLTDTGTVVKYDSTGAYLSAFNLSYSYSGSAGYAQNPMAMVISPNGSLLSTTMTYQWNGSQAANQGNLISINPSNNAVQWKVAMGSWGAYGTSDVFYGCASDSNSNAIAVGAHYVSGSKYAVVAQYNSSGTFQWARQLTVGGTYQIFFYDVVTDNNNNIYVVGIDYTTSGGRLVIVKYDSSGVIQWQRYFANVGSQDSPRIKLNISQTHIYVVTRITGGSGGAYFRTYVLKLPIDGSLTGTYTVGGTTYYYAASSYTDASLSISGTTHTATINNTSLSANTSYPTYGATINTATTASITTL